jgi:hypothetical protein
VLEEMLWGEGGVGVWGGGGEERTGEREQKAAGEQTKALQVRSEVREVREVGVGGAVEGGHRQEKWGWGGG